MKWILLFSTHSTDEKLSSGNISVTQPEAEELHLLGGGLFGLPIQQLGT